jgi:hypothetical protein
MGASNDLPATSSRRALLGSLGAATASLVYSRDLFAQASNPQATVQQSVSEHARPTTHPAAAFKLPRWKPGQARRLDLSKPLDNHYGFAKVQVNLVGTYSWLYQYGWVVFCPPGQPPFPILGRVFLAKIFATPVDPKEFPGADEHSYMMWGTMSQTYVDPRTFEPVTRMRNPYTGRTMEVPVVHYADRLVYRVGQVIQVPGVDPEFYRQPWDRDGGYSQHFVDTGEDTSYSVLGASQQPGPHQPRVDFAFWAARTAEVVDPKFRTVDTRRNYSAVMKATEYAWYGVEKGDQAQLAVNTVGIKTEDPAKLPPLVRRQILERFPERYA